MNFIKKFSLLKRFNIIILLALPLIYGCSGAQLVTSGAGAVVATSEDEKSLGDAFDDVAIGLGIKDRIFMYEAILLTKINVDEKNSMNSQVDMDLLEKVTIDESDTDEEPTPA